MPRSIVLNGEIVEGERIPMEVASAGLSFGYGLFETIKFVNRRPCFLAEHFDRLVESAERISMDFPFSLEEVFRQSVGLFEVNGVDSGVYKIVLTQGLAKVETVLYLRDTVELVSSVSVRLRQSTVVKGSQAFTSNHKTLNYFENLLEMRAAQQHGFDECLFLNEAGLVTECATANVFLLKEGVLKTPAADCGLLKGVIRGRVLQIAGEMGLRVEEGNLLPDDFMEADEAFLTSSGKGVVSVSELWTDRLIQYPVVGSKLVRSLSERLRSAELESAMAFDSEWGKP